MLWSITPFAGNPRKENHMRFILIVVGFLGVIFGLLAIFLGISGPPGTGNIVGSGFLVAGSVFLAAGTATCDIVAAIERRRPQVSTPSPPTGG
jgi:drug/metabolite transporter (DMT)-like permease